MIDTVYHNDRRGSTFEHDDLVGSPTLDRPLRLTTFPSQSATKKRDKRLTLRQLAELIEQTEADDKASLPWFKGAVFGGARSPLRPKPGGGMTGNSYRHDANVVAVTGVEADYDGGEITPEDAHNMMTEAGIAGLIYTTPSHSPDAPRWRVFSPFAEELSPQARSLHMARLNGVLGGGLDPASFTLSQSYYFGNVRGRLKVKTWLVDGRFIDRADDLDAGAIGKGGRAKAESANDNGADEEALLDAIASSANYHTSAITLTGKWAALGVSYLEAMQRLKTAFDRVPEKDRDARWKERVADLPNILNHVFGKQVEEDIADERRQHGAFDDLEWEDWVRDFTTIPPDADAQADIDDLVGNPADAGFFINIGEWSKRPAPAREWLVPEMIPHKQVTLLYGDGGTGKSLLGLQLAAAVASGGEWIGQIIDRPGKAVVIAAEDDADEINRRMEDICRADGISIADMAGKLLIRSVFGEDATLGGPDRKGVIKPTAFYEKLMAIVVKEKPSLIVLDTLANLYAGNENDKMQVSRFMTMIRAFAIKANCAVVVLAHPSMNGIATGTGTGGSVAWSNSVRSRLYLTRIKDDDGNETDDKARVLKTMKANYAASDKEIPIMWRAGAFVAEVEDFREAPDEKARRVFLKLLDAMNRQKRHVSPNVSSTYAPTVFEGHSDREGVRKAAFVRAMESLLADGTVTIAAHGKAGKERQHLERALV